MHIHSNPWYLPPISFQDQYFERYVWPWLLRQLHKKGQEALRSTEVKGLVTTGALASRSPFG